jgi:hypothetical protein
MAAVHRFFLAETAGCGGAESKSGGARWLLRRRINSNQRKHGREVVAHGEEVKVVEIRSIENKKILGNNE